MMMSAPDPDWMAEVMRDCRSLALTVSTFSVMPVAFLHSSVILLLSKASEAGTKSVQRSQWTLAAPWAIAGARPVARMAARPPVDAKSLRRAMRVMAASRGLCVFGKETRRRDALGTTPGNCSTLSDYAGSTLDGAGGQAGDIVLDEEGIDDGDRDRAEQGRGHQLAPVEDVAAHQLGDGADRHGAHLGLGQEDQRVEELVLRQGEGEDAGRDEAGATQRQHDLRRGLQPARAVDPGGILEFAR